MSRALGVLRPEPGNAATVARLRAIGRHAVACPLFRVRALPWTAPPAQAFDALLLTSANAIRCAGADLAGYAGLPVYAVGDATADAARHAGLRVAGVGAADARALLDLAGAAGTTRALHLGARNGRVAVGGIVAHVAHVYTSEPIAADVAPLIGTVALLHSPRAGARFATLAARAGLDRALFRVAAISPAALDAAGAGWDASGVATRPHDDALIAAALGLAD